MWKVDVTYMGGDTFTFEEVEQNETLNNILHELNDDPSVKVFKVWKLESSYLGPWPRSVKS